MIQLTFWPIVGEVRIFAERFRPQKCRSCRCNWERSYCLGRRSRCVFSKQTWNGPYSRRHLRGSSCSDRWSIGFVAPNTRTLCLAIWRSARAIDRQSHPHLALPWPWWVIWTWWASKTPWGPTRPTHHCPVGLGVKPEMSLTWYFRVQSAGGVRWVDDRLWPGCQTHEQSGEKANQISQGSRLWTGFNAQHTLRTIRLCRGWPQRRSRQRRIIF